jgi:hypothetical protein
MDLDLLPKSTSRKEEANLFDGLIPSILLDVRTAELRAENRGTPGEEVCKKYWMSVIFADAVDGRDGRQFRGRRGRPDHRAYI